MEMENSALNLYKAFFDRLVKHSKGCYSKWIKEMKYFFDSMHFDFICCYEGDSWLEE